MTPPGGTVVGFPDIALSYDFYLDRTVVELDRPRVEQLLREAPRGALIVPRSSWTELQSAAHPAWRVIASHRVAGREILVVGARSS